MARKPRRISSDAAIWQSILRITETPQPIIKDDLERTEQQQQKDEEK